MKKKSLIIIVVIIIVAVLSLVIAIMSKSTNNNKVNNTESSQAESESITEETETQEENTSGDKLVDGEVQEDVTVGTNDLGELSQFIPEGAKVEPDEDGKLLVTLENGIQYFMYSDGSRGMTVAQRREALKIDPTYMEHLDPDGFGPGISYDEYKERQANGTLTWEDMANLKGGQMSDEEEARRGADGLYCGDYKQREDGSRYILLDDGTILESGDEMPGGGYWISD